MVNQQLLDYIKLQLSQNVSKEQIKGYLLNNGWTPFDIEEGFVSVGYKEPIVPISTTKIEQPISGIINPVASFSYAGFWRRAFAYLIDMILFGVVSFALSFVYFWFSKDVSALFDYTQIVLGVLFLVLWILYFPFMESLSGATFGKEIIGIKAVKATGESISFLRALGRNLSKIISGSIFMIGFFMAGFTEKKQALHDMIADCVVVKVSNVKKIWLTTFIVLVLGGIVAFVLFITSILFSLSAFLPSLPYLMFQDSPSFSASTTPLSTTGNDVENNTDNNIDNNVASSSFVALSGVEYDAYFSKKMVGLEGEEEYQTSNVNAGPALIAYDDFFGLIVAMPVIPNLENGSDYVWVDITSVISNTSKEVFDKDIVFEKDVFFKGLNLSKKTMPVEYLSALRNIHLIGESKIKYAKTIKGILQFKIPLNSEDSKEFYEKSYPFTINI